MLNRRFLITQKIDADVVLERHAQQQAQAAGKAKDPLLRVELERRALEIRRDATRARQARRML
jgi:hypothetical protein